MRKGRTTDRVVGWSASVVAGLLASLLLNLTVAFVFGNGRHPRLIEIFFKLSELLLHPGFEGGIALVAGNVLILMVPFTLVFAGLLRRYTF